MAGFSYAQGESISHHKPAAKPATIVIALGLIVLAVFVVPAIIWAAIAWAFPAIGLTYWQTVALHIAFRAVTLHLQPVSAKKVAK